MPKLKTGSVSTVIPNKIAAKRQELGFSIKDMAEVLEIPYGTYGTIDSGHTLPSARILRMLIVVFKCEPIDLYDQHVVNLILYGRWTIIEE